PPDYPSPNALSTVLAIQVFGDGFDGAPYEVGRTYTVVADTTLEDLTGRHLSRPYSFSFTPEPSFRVISVVPSGRQPFEPAAWVQVSFNPAVDATTFASLHLSPPFSGQWAMNGPQGVRFEHLEPFPYGAHYELRIDETAHDVHGNRLQAPVLAGFDLRR